jgi:hypothetical protein
MPAVRQPQRKFLIVLFTPSLARRGRVTGRTLSRYCAYSERTMARQCRAAFNWPEFPQPGLTAAREPTADLLSVQAASFMPKSGKQTVGRGHFFTGGANRAERGLESSPLAVVAVSRRGAFTLAGAQTPPDKADASKGPRAEATRREFSKQHLHAQRHRLPAGIHSQCGEGYFAKPKSVDEGGALNRQPSTTLRHDAKWLLL